MMGFNLPRHLAVIMDGNGRWAKSRHHHRSYGHIRGALRAKEIIEECARLQIPSLTLFAFSNENWQRPVAEVSLLMRLMIKQLRKEQVSLLKNNIRFHCIGDLARLPQAVQTVVTDTVELTSRNSGMDLIFALSYGGRQDLVAAAKSVARDIENGKLSADQVDEALLASRMAGSFLPDPDLIIRTSGESRLSNFYLWQAAYSEIYVTDTLWPDFTKTDLVSALKFFSSRERRFGRTTDQVLEERWPRSRPG
jgi:undecaprenyl diphosphate synthase